MRSHTAKIVVDLGFGDAGKGTMIDYLARNGRAAAVVRFNGGGQAAHNVVTPDGRHHTFSQFGSGSFVHGVRSHISRFSLLDPVTLYHEAGILSEVVGGTPLSRLSIDESALVVTPFHKAANRLREAKRGLEGHGTCGQGIGEAVGDSLQHDDAIRARDFHDLAQLRRKLRQIQERKFEELRDISVEFRNHPELGREVTWLEGAEERETFATGTVAFGSSLHIVDESHLAVLAQEGDLLFEGAQGVLLDEWYGFHPHTTWSTTTFENALSLLSEIGYSGDIERIGVMRAYHTRHGAGPFPSHDSELSTLIPDLHNGSAGWQGEFRVGWLDFVLGQYALEVCGGADALAVTNLDRLMSASTRKVCTSYRLPDGSKVTRLPVKQRKEDLSHQENLTSLLTSATPMYTRAPEHQEPYLQLIEAQLGLPVRYTSCGPSALEKSVRSAYVRQLVT